MHCAIWLCNRLQEQLEFRLEPFKVTPITRFNSKECSTGIHLSQILKFELINRRARVFMFQLLPSKCYRITI
jgi:hypothetical protein